MEEFNTDEPQVEGSGINNPNDPEKKATKPLPKPNVDLTLGSGTGIEVPQFRLPKLDNSGRVLDIGLSKEKFDSKFKDAFITDDIPKRLAEYQSNWDRAGNLAIRMGANVIGGMISAVGSPHAIGEAIADEANNRDADFGNALTEWGDGIKEWAKENFPNHRLNPDKSWDFNDPAAWFFGGVESIASTLEFLAPTYGFVKGMSAVARVAQVEKALVKLGANAQKIKLASKIAAGAAFQRNAENMMESSQLVKQQKEQLMEEFSSNPEKFEEMKNSKVGKELAAEGREVTPESLSTFIAGKAGWEAYKTNSINIVFDALQIAPLVRGFNPGTRLGGFRTPSAVKAANRQAINPAAKGATKMEKVFDITNPFISATGRSASEGVEEIINYYGSLRGRNVANELTGKPQEKADIGEMTEAGFWGSLGGLAFEGGARLLNRNKSNTETNQRLGEISNRVAVMKQASDAIRKINESDMSEEDKSESLKNLKSELSLDLGIRAAQAGNVDLLLNQIQSKEFADQMVQMGVADPKEIDKSVANAKEDILLAEKLYKEYYNTFQFMEGSETAKNSLLNKSIVTDFFVQKNIKRRNEAAVELNALKVKDPYVRNHQSPNLETMIELEGLLTARNAVNKTLRRAEKKGDNLLSSRGKAEIENLNKRIVDIKGQIGSERIDKEQINPRIIEKQAEIILADATNNIQQYKIKEYSKPNAAKKEDQTIKEKQKEAEENLVKEAEDATKNLSSAEIAQVKEKVKANEAPQAVVKKIEEVEKQVKAKEQTAAREESVKKDKETPIPVTTEGEFAGLPEYAAEPYDEAKIDSFMKQDIDRLIEAKDYKNLEWYVADEFKNQKTKYSDNSHTASYARTKLAEARAKAAKAAEVQAVQQLNAELPEIPRSGFEFDEFQEHSQTSGNITIDEVLGSESVVDQIISLNVESNANVSFSKEEVKRPNGSIVDRVTLHLGNWENSRKDVLKTVQRIFKELRDYKPGSVDFTGNYMRVIENSAVWYPLSRVVDYYQGRYNISLETLEEELAKEFKLATSTPKTVEEDEDTTFEFLSKESENKPVATAWVPMFREFGVNAAAEGHQEYYQKKGGDIQIQDKYIDMYTTAMNPELTEGTEIEIYWDKDNKYTWAKHKGDKNNEAFGLRYKGKTFAYLGTISMLEAKVTKLQLKAKALMNPDGRKPTKAELKKAESLMNLAEKIKLDLPEIQKIRNQLELSDKVFKTKMAMKGNGTMISRGTGPTALRSLRGISTDLYALNTTRSKKKLVNLEDETKGITSANPLTPGKVYMGVKDANNKVIPVPLTVSKVNPIQAKIVVKNIEQLLEELNQGKDSGSQEVRALKDEINKFVSVDRMDNYDKPVGFRVHPQSIRKEDQTTRNARIEIGYTNVKGEKKKAVLMKSHFNGELWMGIYDGDKKTYEVTSGDNDFYKALNGILKLKYHHINFPLINSKKAAPFQYNGKTYPTYKDYLIDEEILKTDVAQVVDKNGKVLGNLFGFDNDFKILIESDLSASEEKVDEKKEEAIAKATLEPGTQRGLFDDEGNLLDLFFIDQKPAETVKNDYKDKYELLRSGSSSSTALLKEIAANPVNNSAKELADWLLKTADRSDMPVVLADLSKRKGVNASYNPQQHRIRITDKEGISETKFQYLFLHEMVHGVTTGTMLRSYINTIETTAALKTPNAVVDLSAVKFKEGTPEYIKDFVSEIIDLRNKAMDGLTKKYGKSVEVLTKDDRFYGLENVFEFISETMTNPEFQNELKSLNGEQNIIVKFFNEILRALKRFFNIKTTPKEDEILQRSMHIITNFVNLTEYQGKFTEDELNVEFPSRMTDEFENKFSREEIIEIIETMEGFISNAIRNNQIDYQDNFEDRDKNFHIRDNIHNAWRKYHESMCPEAYKDKVGEILQQFHKFYDRAISHIHKNFKIGTAYDINLIQENDGLVRNWDDTKAQEISSQDTIPRQIKLFIGTVPELDNLDHKYDANGNPIWNRKKSTFTGIAKYVDFNVLYPYMIRNLVGARTRAEIITRLENMSRNKPSFAFIAHELRRNENLLAQFESSLAKKTVYDSYVTFITDLDDNREIWIKDELKASRYDIAIADDWALAINKEIDKLETEADVKKFDEEMQTLFDSANLAASRSSYDKELLRDKIHQIANKLGIDLSLSTIESVINSARSTEDVESNLINVLDAISDSIKRKKKGFDFKRLNSLAKIESIYRFDVIENSGLDIKGNLIYAIRNPSFISNWFNDIKAETPEGREDFERYLSSVANVPAFQFSTMLWNTGSSPGFLNFELKDGRRVPLKKGDHLDVNWDFVSRVAYHDYGGAKETLSKEAQKYGEFTDNDWKLMNLISYLNINDKRERDKDFEKNWVLIPTIIASDSGKAGLLEVPKIKLNKTDIYRTPEGRLKVKQDSNLFKAVLSVAWSEVRSIQQATEKLFDIVDNKLVVKKGLKPEHLQQYFHYGKEMVLREDGTVDMTKTLLNPDGTPTGQGLYFHNITVKDVDANGKPIVKTLEDVEGIKVNNHLAVGQLDKVASAKISKFVETFIDQQIKQVLADYRSLEVEVAGKHKNVVDGSFEALVAEFALNQFVYNHEQFLFFNGTIAEYKNKIETNKRAKQLFTPGVGLSLEAMKITYENGTQGDGETFKSITIKDIKTKSHTIDFITTTVKDALMKERKYTKAEIKAFSAKEAQKKDAYKTHPNKLVQDVNKIINGYLSINSADAQGYMTLDRLESLIRGRGQWNDRIEGIIRRAREGRHMTEDEINEMLRFGDRNSLQPQKPFYYEREYDAANNKMTSTQIKYSSIPLIPAMVRGTELEKLMDYMNKNAVDEAIFESAHKVGAKMIYKIDNPDGTINTSVLNKAKPNVYLNKNYRIQLDTPEHLLDEENLLAKQISKLIIANINPNTTYNIGVQKYTGQELIKHYFDVWSENIETDAIKLLEELNIEVKEDGYIIRDENLQGLLKAEIEKRGLSDNYMFAIELNERKEFKLPLFVNNMATKWEAILTSIFTNNIIKQKAPGGSVVLASRMFLDKGVTQGEYEKDSQITPVDISDIEREQLKQTNSEEDINAALKVAGRLMKLTPKSLFKKLQDVHIFASVGERNSWRPDLGLSTKEFEATIKQIEAGKETKTTQIVYDYLANVKETGNLDMLIGTGGTTEKVQMPLYQFLLDKEVRRVVDHDGGIRWSKEKANDHTLRSFTEENGQVKVVEVLMGGWSKNLYRHGQLMDIDEIPDEIKTMIGYRIPTTSKSYMTVFKVVGFLPEEAKGVIVTPDDMVTQMGQDFDIDKWFLMNKEFIRTRKGKFIIPKYSSKEEFDALREDVEELTKDSYMSVDDATLKLSDKLAQYMKLPTRDELQAELKEKRELLKQFGKYNEKGEFEYNEKSRSRAARNNEIFDIYKAILTHPAHFKEILTPSGYPNVTEMAGRIDTIFNENDNNINPLTESGQRAFRRRNIAGKNLLGISANFNGFTALAQVSNMKLNKKIAFTFKFNLAGRDVKQLKARYGKDITIFGDTALISFKQIGKAPDGSFLNVNGELIMEVASELVVAAADNAKDPLLEKLNLSTYTAPTFYAGLAVGVPMEEMAFFMRQPILKRLNEYYFDNKSLLADNTGRQIEIVKRLYQTHLYNELVRQDPQYSNKRIKLAVDETIRIKSELNSLKGKEGKADVKKSKELVKELQAAEKKLEDIRKTFKNIEKRAENRRKNKAPLNYDLRYLAFINRRDTQDVLGYDPDSIGATTFFTAEELEEQLEWGAKGFENLNNEQRLKYLKSQLYIIEYFNRWKKAGEALSDMAKVSKTDGIGAGPTMDVTSELVRTIESLDMDDRIEIDGEPAVKKLFPQHFELDEESVYKPIEAYFEYGNKLSRDVLGKLFVNQTRPFKNVVYTVAGMVKPGKQERRTLNESETKTINRFLNVNLLQDFDQFKTVNKAQVLGVAKEPTVNEGTIDIDTFKQLSTAEKVDYLQKTRREYLLSHPQHVLNFLTPILDKKIAETKGYHELAFLFYKNEFTDDNLADSLAMMYETGDEFEQELSKSLIDYAFVTNGLTYGLRSFAKVIPTETLWKMGLGEFLRQRQRDLHDGLSGFDSSTIDQFFRNNWANSDFIPVVRTKWDFVKDPTTGRKYIRTDDEGNRFTKDRSPVWNAENMVISVDHRALETMGAKIEQAPYVSIWTKDGLKLYKKYTKTVTVEGGYETYDKFDGNIYYYRVNKLGKDGIFEFSDRSMFPENNVENNEEEAVMQVENIINNLKKQANAAKTNNTTKEKKNEIINKCKMP